MSVDTPVRSGRRSARVRLVIPCDIKGSKETLRVPLRDISLDGCRLATAEPSSVGDTLQLTLRLLSRIELSAEVRWVEHDVAKGQYVLGCCFSHAGDSRQQLKNTLQSMAAATDTAARRVR
jgi:c-di-GMP-binding flagellar brake protein YcgR